MSIYLLSFLFCIFLLLSIKCLSRCDVIHNPVVTWTLKRKSHWKRHLFFGSSFISINLNHKKSFFLLFNSHEIAEVRTEFLINSALTVAKSKTNRKYLRYEWLCVVELSFQFFFSFIYSLSLVVYSMYVHFVNMDYTLLTSVLNSISPFVKEQNKLEFVRAVYHFAFHWHMRDFFINFHHFQNSIFKSNVPK